MALDLHAKTKAQAAWEHMTREQKNRQLFLNQKALLDCVLERRAISRAQYEKSLGDLIAKMHVA